MSYRTVNLPFKLSGDIANKLIFTTWMFRCAVTTVFEKVRQTCSSYPTKSFIEKNFAIIAKRFLPLAHYAYTACRLVYEICASCKELKIPLTEVEFSNWLFVECRGDPSAKGNQGIKLLDITTCKAKLLVDYGKLCDFVFKVSPPKSRRFRVMVEELLTLCNERKASYDARLYINSYCPGRVYGVLQVTVLEWLWRKYVQRDPEVITPREAEYVLGLDVNADNVTWCLVDLDGKLVEHGAIYFTHLVTQGRHSKGARGFVIRELHKLFAEQKLYKKRKFVAAVENPEVLSRLKLVWIRSGERKHERYNYWVSIFRPSLVHDIVQVADEWSITCIPVNPRGTTDSHEHREVMKRFGIDRHRASAYLIALRALVQLKQSRNMQTYSLI